LLCISKTRNTHLNTRIYHKLQGNLSKLNRGKENNQKIEQLPKPVMVNVKGAKGQFLNVQKTYLQQEQLLPQVNQISISRVQNKRQEINHSIDK